MIPVVITAANRMFSFAGMDGGDYFEAFYDNVDIDNLDKYPLCQTCNCVNLDEINKIIAQMFIKILKYNDLFQNDLIRPTEYMISNKDKMCDGKLSTSETIYYYLINEMNIKVDYFDDNKWNKFDVNCYNEFKELYVYLDVIIVYNIVQNIIKSLQQN